MKTTNYRPFIHLIALTLLSLLILIGCGGTEDAPADNDTVVAPTTAPEPTVTPEPTEATTGEVESNSSSTSDVLSSLLAGNTNETEETQAEEISPPTATPIPQFEPVEVSINLQQGELSPWIEVIPPPGWFISQGVDGYILSRNPADIPNTPFVIIRRWGNVVNLGDWIAYLPDGQEEPSSAVRIGLAGLEWDGIFITNADNTYRAFFAVSNNSIPSYTVLMYIPSPGNQELTREEMLAVWERDADDLNSILRRLIIS